MVIFEPYLVSPVIVFNLTCENAIVLRYPVMLCLSCSTGLSINVASAMRYTNQYYITKEVFIQNTIRLGS